MPPCQSFCLLDSSVSLFLWTFHRSCEGQPTVEEAGRYKLRTDDAFDSALESCI